MAVKKSMRDLMGGKSAAMRILEQQVDEQVHEEEHRLAQNEQDAAPDPLEQGTTAGEEQVPAGEDLAADQVARDDDIDEPFQSAGEGSADVSVDVDRDAADGAHHEDEGPVETPGAQVRQPTAEEPLEAAAKRSVPPRVGRPTAAVEPVRRPVRPVAGRSSVPPSQARASAPVPTVSGRPHFSTLVRKELRVFRDQQLALNELTMEQKELRGLAGERISDNTFVRIAIDLLLERRHDLAGATEDELRASLGLPPRY